MMSFLRRLFAFIKVERLGPYVQSISMQYYFTAISCLTIAFLGNVILYDAYSFIYITAFLAVPLLAFAVLVIFASLYEVWLHSLGEIHNFRWRMCKTISLLGLFLPILFYLKFRNSDMQDFLLVFLYYSMFPIFNTFIWLFKKNKTKRDVPFLRFIVILTTDFLFFLSCTFPYNHQLKEILLFIPISAATAVIYICWADSTDIVAKMAITTNPENGFKTVVPKLPIEMKSLIKNRQAIPFMDSAFSRYYIFFILLSFIPLIGIWCNGGNLVEHHSASQHALTLIAFGVPIFFMCWGIFLITHPKGVGVKICTIISLTALIPCLVYALFTLFLI